jgi:amidase/aspartyl-tRNA(Asn)/glutamyl-tRNA(Gln) amidotransferase subunit A
MFPTALDPRMDDELCFWSAIEVAAAIRKGQVSPVAVFEAIARRIEARNPRINGYVTLTLDQARDAAKKAQEALAGSGEIGPLHGVPVAVKDDLAVQGVRYTCGSNLLSGYTADQDDLTVKRLRHAGAVILGKTNLPEFGHKGTTDNLVFGATNNPWDITRVAGGSSGGSAAVVSDGMAYLALGTDIGGSVRIPSSCCGVVGHKPSLGRVPRVPGGNFFNTAWTAGPIARTAADAALGLQVISGPDIRDPFSIPAFAPGELNLNGDLSGLCIGWSPSPTGAPVESVVADAARRTVGLLETRGVHIEDRVQTVPIPIGPIRCLLGGDILSVFELIGINSPLYSLILRVRNWFSSQYRFSPSFAPLARRGYRTSLWRYIAAQRQITDFVEQSVSALFGECDLLATPTIALPPFPHPGLGELGPVHVAGQAIDRHIGWMFTWPFNLSGQPAVSIPCGWVDNRLPIGLQLVGRRCADGLVLRVAAAIERLQPWCDLRPSP